MKKSRIVQGAFAVAAAAALTLGGCSTSGGGGGGGGGGSSALTKLTAAPVCADAKAPTKLGSLPSKPDPSVKGTVSLWGWYNVAPKSTLDLMKKYYPNVTLKFSDFSLGDTLTKTKTALNAGTGAPNLAMIEDLSLPSVWGDGLYDLSSCLKPYTEAFPKFKMNRITRADGAQPGVPWDINPGYVTYRKDVFSKYGIDADSIKTWADFTAAGKKVVKASGGDVAWTESNTVDPGNGTENVQGDIALLSDQIGADFFDAKGNSTFDSAKNIQVLKLLKSFRDDGLAAQDFGSKQAELNALKDGKVATFIGEASSRFFMAGSLGDTAGKWGILPLPAFTEGGTRGAVNGGTSIVMPSQNKETEASWAFLRIWLLTVDGRYESFKAGQLVENVFLPAAEDERFQQGDPFYGGDKFLDLSITAAQDAPPTPSAPNLAQVKDSIQSQLAGFMKGSISAEQLAKTAQAAADK